MRISRRTAIEAKGLVFLAFRAGPIEPVHTGNEKCPTCRGVPGYARITDDEMKAIMTAAVNMLATMLTLRETDLAEYEKRIVYAMAYVEKWDEPQPVPEFSRRKAHQTR
jgi:hypothetical protein